MDRWASIPYPYPYPYPAQPHADAPATPNATAAARVPGPRTDDVPRDQAARTARGAAEAEAPEPVVPELAAFDPAAFDPAQQAARLAMVARHTDDAVVIYGPDGRIDWVNDAFVRTTGLTLADVVGARRTDLVRGPFTRTAQFAEIAADLQARRSVSTEFVTRTKDGVPYWVAMDVRIAVQDGLVVGQIGVERDITLRRQAEGRARQTLRHAESLGVALKHEKQAVLDRLDLDFVADEVPSALTQSLEGLERVSGIVRAMKDFSHPGQGRALVDLSRVVETTAQVSRNEWKYVAEVVLDLAVEAGPVPCYEGELKQVLLNVIVNAAQAIDERRTSTGARDLGRITVSTRTGNAKQ